MLSQSREGRDKHSSGAAGRLIASAPSFADRGSADVSPGPTPLYRTDTISANAPTMDFPPVRCLRARYLRDRVGVGVGLRTPSGAETWMTDG